MTKKEFKRKLKKAAKFVYDHKTVIIIGSIIVAGTVIGIDVCRTLAEGNPDSEDDDELDLMAYADKVLIDVDNGRTDIAVDKTLEHYEEVSPWIGEHLDKLADLDYIYIEPALDGSVHIVGD